MICPDCKKQLYALYLDDEGIPTCMKCKDNDQLPIWHTIIRDSVCQHVDQDNIDINGAIYILEET